MVFEDGIKAYLDDNLSSILVRLNSSGRLEELAKLIGANDLLAKNDYEVFATGKIFVAGASAVTEDVLRGIAKRFGIGTDRLEFCLGYEEAKKFNYGKLQWKPEYAAIVVGPMPHSGDSKGDYSSIITALEKEQGFPPVYRMGTNELKITKTGFRNLLNELIEKGVVVTD